jgi:hypothetical protein
MGMPKAQLTFATESPARFELDVDEKGHVHLFGYSGTKRDGNQEPDLVFDTDGSLCALGSFSIDRTDDAEDLQAEGPGLEVKKVAEGLKQGFMHSDLHKTERQRITNAVLDSMGIPNEHRRALFDLATG